MNNWNLNRIDDIQWKQDSSGVYVYVNWDLLTDSVRLDIMVEANAEPLQSFIGRHDNVRKAVMRWLSDNVNHASEPGTGFGPISLEHAAYIGAELERSDNERIDYVQD